MRTIVPLASSPLHLLMSPTATTETHEHIPTVLNPHELSRSSSPQQSNLSLLVSTASISPESRPTASAGVQRPCRPPIATSRCSTEPTGLACTSATALGTSGLNPVHPFQRAPVGAYNQWAPVLLERDKRVFTRPLQCRRRTLNRGFS